MTGTDPASVAAPTRVVGHPTVSVVVVVGAGAAHDADDAQRAVDAATRAVSGTPSDDVELVVVDVAEGPSAVAPPSSSSSHRVRHVASPGATLADALDAAALVARHDYLVVLPETGPAAGSPTDGAVTRALAAAAPGRLVGVPDATDTSSEPGEPREPVAPDEVWTRFGTEHGWLVATDVARSRQRDPALGGLAAAAYWTTLLDLHELELVAPRGTVPTPRAEGTAPWLRLVSTLQRLPRHRPATVRLVRRWVELAADRTRAAVADGAATQGDLVEQVAQEQVPRMPWDLVNADRAEQLALLYCFPPSLDTSGLVAARRLEELGLVTDVVSQDLGALRGRDPDAVRVSDPWVARSHVVGGPADFSTWRAVRDFTRSAVAQAERWQGGDRPHEQLYSRAMAVHSHVAAALLKLRHPRLRWVAEFSDPLLHNDMGETRATLAAEDWLLTLLARGLREAGAEVPAGRRMYEWAEVLPYALADEVVFTNDHQRDFMLGYCADPRLVDRARERSRVARHPVPRPELYGVRRPRYPLEGGLLHVGYFGAFYRSRGVEELTGALARLGFADRCRVRVHVFTDKPEAVAAQVVADGLADVVVVNPMLGFLEYLHLTTRFDLLYVSDYATASSYDLNPYLPAKVADYLGSGTPVWAVTEPGSVLDGLPVAWRTPRHDVGAAARLLARLARDRAAEVPAAALDAAART